MSIKRKLSTSLVLFGLTISTAAYAATPLERAAAAGNMEKVQKLIAKGANVNEVDPESTFEKTPLYVASENGHADIVAYLLSKGADPAIASMSDATPLRKAAYHGHVEAVRALLEAGAKADEDKDYLNRTPMVWALIAAEKGDSKKYVEIIGLLKKHGASCQETFTHPVNDSKIKVEDTAKEAGEQVYAAYKKLC